MNISYTKNGDYLLPNLILEYYCYEEAAEVN